MRRRARGPSSVEIGTVFNIYMYLTRIYGNLKQIQPDLVCSYFVFVFFRMPNLIQPATRAALKRLAQRPTNDRVRDSRRFTMAVSGDALWSTAPP